MSTVPVTAKSPLAFFTLVFVMAVPFYLVDAVNRAQIVRGVPLAGFAVVCPAIAAVILRFRVDGWIGATQLLKRSWDIRRVTRKIWYIPALGLYPAVVVASFVMLRATGHNIPNPRFSPVSAVLLGIGFLVGAVSEELGWTGYATEPLQNRWNAVYAGLVIGSVWAVWHWIPLIQVHRSPAWIAWWSLATVAARVIIVWIFNNAGHSVFITALFHMTVNLAWQLFPVNGSYFNQPLVAVIMVALALVAVVMYGPTTLSGRRRGIG